ncbi:hypothetical protein ACWEPA_22220 [Streptomyces filamentosus]
MERVPAGATDGVLRAVAGDPAWRVVRDGDGIVLLHREKGQPRA